MTLLLLSTPDGIPGTLIDLFQSSLLDIVVSNRSLYGSSGVDALGRHVGQLHDKILSEQQKTWFQLNERDLPAHKKAIFTKKMEAVNNRLPADENCGIYDPAMVFFAPLWCEVLPSPELLFYYSEPMETALQLRNTWRFPISAGLALWEYYVCRALNLLAEGEHVVISSRELRQDPARQLLEITAWLKRLTPLKSQPLDAEAMARALRLDPVDDELDPAQYMNDAQKQLHSELESGRIEKDKHRICEQSRDLLFHYGNLRAGFESVKNECRALTLALRRAGEHKEETMSDQLASATLSESNSEDDLLNVVVYIKNMEPLVFAAPSNSPTLDMLLSVLRAPATAAGKIIYLQFGTGEYDALYFPIGSLLAVNTTGATSQ